MTVSSTHSPGPAAGVREAADSGTDPVLKVRGLTRSYSGLRAVDDVSFEVEQGQVVTIIGPNGSGKTSTLNLITGLIRPDSGRIHLCGQRIDNTSVEAIAEAGIGRTFQNGRVFGNLSVADNVLVGMHSTLTASRPFARLARYPLLRWIPLLAETALALVPTPAVRREQRQARIRMEEELSRFGERLTPRQDNYTYTLSYANRRRTEIARALALRPRLLLLDEPTAGMNTTETAEVLEQLLELKRQGQTMLLIEHKLDLVMAVSDRVVVMDNGKVIADGPPRVVREDERVIEAYLGRRHARSDTATGAARPGTATPDGGPDSAVDAHDTADKAAATEERS
ncbi:ABC transporter ATP-binding protein [Streptomyces sp.]|uniref:ABC transporter ATP-binding protein n=1 Tax=Streptomyces sp. TaxID=1931 RepID=UPI002F409D97